MAYSIRQSNEFSARLDDAIEYVSKTLGSPRAAKAILDELTRQLNVIRETPRWFPVDRTLGDWFLVDIYRATVRSYVMFYVVNEKTKTVYLVTFRHESQDISTFEDYDFYEN